MTRAHVVAVLAAAGAIGGLLVLRRSPEPRPGESPSSSAVLPAPADAAGPPASAGTTLAAGAEISPELTTIADDDAFRLLVFPVRVAGARFRVVDLGMKRDLERVLAETGASLVINGGFFDPAERPEGLVISGGVILSPRSDSLGGGIVTVAEQRVTLAPTEGFVAPPGTDFAIQARPRLVVDGGRVIVRDDGRAAERTALCLREQGRTLEVVVARGEGAGRGPTLALLADMLVSRGCEGALNLDGGPSTGVAWKQNGEVRALAPRGPLRHAIAIWAPSGSE
jgi:uncharacterized protein YigE (DUF2233 family)